MFKLYLKLEITNLYRRNYSTSTNIKRSSNIDVNFSAKSFKIASPIINNLNTIIKDNPINSDTQIKIERFCLIFLI